MLPWNTEARLEAQKVWVSWVAVHLHSIQKPIREPYCTGCADQCLACEPTVALVGLFNLLTAEDRCVSVTKADKLFCKVLWIPDRQAVQAIGPLSPP